MKLCISLQNFKLKIYIMLILLRNLNAEVEIFKIFLCGFKYIQFQKYHQGHFDKSTFTQIKFLMCLSKKKLFSIFTP